MDGLKKIMYGVTDFPQMRREDAYFVDRTALTSELEKTPYALLLRPRRFDKSPLCAILQFYYDIDYAGSLRTRIGIPSQTVGEFLHDFIGRACDAVYGVDARVFDIANGGYTDIAFHRQLVRPAAGRDLARAWHLKPQGTVKLTRFAIAFHGMELALCEEI